MLVVTLFIACVMIGVVIFILTMWSKSSCKGSDKHGIYTKNSQGSCVLTKCIKGWGLSDDICVQDGSPCGFNGTFKNGVCNQKGVTKCEDVKPDICKTSCMLPFPIVGTNSTKPDANFLSYKTVGKYCQLDTCKTGIVNNEMCDQLDCTGDVSPNDNHDYPDPNALWMRDASGKCQFYKCKPNFTSVNNSCVSSDDICTNIGSASSNYEDDIDDPKCTEQCTQDQIGYRICGAGGMYGTCTCVPKSCSAGISIPCTCSNPADTARHNKLAKAMGWTVQYEGVCNDDKTGYVCGAVMSSSPGIYNEQVQCDELLPGEEQ
jgi:hypothetical protein